jgi:hypothetical protein
MSTKLSVKKEAIGKANKITGLEGEGLSQQSWQVQQLMVTLKTRSSAVSTRSD